MIKIILVICILIMGKFLEQWERENSTIFWDVSILLAITFSSFDKVQFQTTQTPPVIEKNTASVLVINSGGEGVSFADIFYNSNSQSEKIISIRGGSFNKKGNRSRKPKKFDANFHRILQKGFPDWERRIEYEKKQRYLYKSAQKKLKMSPIGISSSEQLFSPEEKDAIAYFQGTGFYSYCQKLEEKPNIFDTRETFLLKMHNPEMRENFLNGLTRLSEKNLE